MRRVVRCSLRVAMIKHAAGGERCDDRGATTVRVELLSAAEPKTN